MARESVGISVSCASIEEVVLAPESDETDADVVCVVSAKARWSHAPSRRLTSEQPFMSLAPRECRGYLVLVCPALSVDKLN